LHVREPNFNKGGVMRKRVASATCAAIAVGMTVALLAQNPPSTTQPPSGTMAVQTVTVTGCLKPAQVAAGTTTGTTTATMPKFVLTNLVMAPTGTAGTTGTAPASSAAVITEYRLDFDETKLSPHVGHKVEISGTPVVVAAAAAPSGASATVQTLKVSNVKMIAVPCP
jgi:hypothetical protein